MEPIIIGHPELLPGLPNLLKQMKAQWRDEFIAIVKEEAESKTKIREIRPKHIYSRFTSDSSEDSDSSTYDIERGLYNVNISDEQYYRTIATHESNIVKQRKALLARMERLFVTEPKFEPFCKQLENRLLVSGFKEYVFNFKLKECNKVTNNFEYLINLCGFTLEKLVVQGYTNSDIVPTIKTNCTDLKELHLLTLKDIESSDFEDVFSNMSQLEALTTQFFCKDSKIPLTLIKSLEHVSKTLKRLLITCDSKRFHPSEPSGSSSSVELFSPENEILMAIVGRMNNLEYVTICFDYSVTDEFLINIANNSKNLQYLYISGADITDEGIIALNNLNQLAFFGLNLSRTGKKNELITDQSIKSLASTTMKSLDISNCVNICTDSSIVELIKGLPNLCSLYIKNTKVTLEDVKKTCNLKKRREVDLTVHVSFEVPDNFQSKTKSNICFKGSVLSLD